LGFGGDPRGWDRRPIITNDGRRIMTMMLRRRTALAAGIAAGALVAPLLARRARAQDPYHAGRTARIVVPFAAGGTTDTLARIVARILGESTGATFVIDNRAGAGGNVSAEIVARAVPDGLTLLLGTVGTAVTNQYLYRDVPYDSVESFMPVALLGQVPNVLVVHPSFPASTLREFVDYCRLQGPNNVTYSSPALGSTGHLAMEYLSGLAGIKLEYVAYRGRSAMMKALTAGHVPVAMDNLPAYLPHIRSGALRALGVTSARRWFAAPDVPAIAELGYPEFDATLWWYMAAPAGTRVDVVNRLSGEIVNGIKTEQAIRKIREAGASELPGNADDLTRHMAAENVKWKKVIETARLKPQ